jgi:hypothetical protein
MQLAGASDIEGGMRNALVVLAVPGLQPFPAPPSVVWEEEELVLRRQR